MSRIKDMLMDIQELYHSGMKSQDIAEILNVSTTLVNDAIYNFCGVTKKYKYYKGEEIGSND
jgi:orotate phosphoribosyltransferase-like protein